MKGLALTSQRAPKPDALICQLCQSSAKLAVRYRPQTRSYASATKASRRPQIGQCLSKKKLTTPSTTLLPLQRYRSTESKLAASPDFKAPLREIEHGSAELRDSQTVPANDAVVQLLQKCLSLAEAIAQPDRFTAEKDNEISSLLNLEERNTKKASKATQDDRFSQSSAATLCRIVHELLTDEKVFISPEALSFYVKIHTLLKRPEHFPEIFYLYANKPIPEEGSSPIKYLSPNPKGINSAIPIDLANIALNVAIEQRNLALVLSIIDNTFCTSAFQRAKFFRKAAAPLGALAMTPLGCYVAASWAASFQNTMEPSTATTIAFAATLAYVGGTSSVGLMAILTANDHMERVVWIPGVPLRERWLREEERAALDRVALAWGFKDVYMRGEEEGEEWESLREFIGMRGMILDKTDLMQGMQ